jgi:malate dehydrogenase
MTKISLIGAGNLGSFIAYEIASRNLAEEIVLVDILKDLAEGQAMDIQQSLVNQNKTKVISGDYDKIKDSEIVVIIAGKARTPEMNDRLQLASINIKIMNSILKEIKEHAPNSTIITVSNPMDILNHYIYQQGWAKEKVIGFGGQLDSARFKVTLGYPEQEIEGYVLGEHGEGQVPIFSKVKIDNELKEFSEEEKQKIKNQSRSCAQEVISKKGATVFAPASNVADMVEAIVKDQKKLMICSTNLTGEYNINDVSLGVPVILGKNGIEEVQVWDLAEDEFAALNKAAEKLKAFYEEIMR